MDSGNDAAGSSSPPFGFDEDDSLALTLPSERDASLNQEPPTTTTDTLAAVPSTDDGGRPRTIALACRPPPHPTGRGSAVKKQSATVGTKTVSTSTTKRKTNGARLASTLTPSTPEATSSGVQLLNSLGFTTSESNSLLESHEQTSEPIQVDDDDEDEGVDAAGDEDTCRKAKRKRTSCVWNEFKEVEVMGVLKA
ncbi:hypothetical protein GQ55_5G404900 [Panicum hallii var. hallii]|uniref:Uncharacterized protein n=1 Tax=Panicum hallii var. hallii TaxID=1504633 RepID=A0A2T7DNL8_9POAL|nr:hypothetical protein GQ55_5G404900 [Panicum hallii var. hallii]